MLKYKLKNNPIKLNSSSYLEDYLRSVGVVKPSSFISLPTEEDEEHYSKLENIEIACEKLYEGFKQNKKFFLQVDSDTDGYTSAAIFYGFFKELFPNAHIEWRLHNAKEHGVILSTVPVDANYVIIPDAGSMQIDEQYELSRMGYETIILDHHNMEGVPRIPNVTIVNNQESPLFQNKALSGAGVVYKTIQCFNEMYSDEFPITYHNYIDLAALGIVSDMMDTRTLDNNYIISRGLRSIKNQMFWALLDKQAFSIKDTTNPTKIDIAFYIAPLINAVIRYGTTEEKEMLFKGFINPNITEVVETMYRGVIRRENYYDFVARTATNVRGRQNRDKEKSMEFLSQRIEKEGLHRNQLLIVKVSKTDEVQVNQTITGLVAMELLKKYRKPTLVLRPKSDREGGIIYAGSGRGKANGKFTSLFGMLQESELCEFVAGHDMAHGVGIREENLEKVIEFANRYLVDVEFDVDDVEVDYIHTSGPIPYKMVEEFGKHIEVFGHLIPQPKFAFELKIPMSEIRLIGKNANTLKFSRDGVDFIKFNLSPEISEKLTNTTDLIEIKCVGRAQINEWRGTQTPQIMIDEIQIKPIELNDLF